MKKRYCVNNIEQDNGDNEVHVEGCRYFPSNRTNLGEHYDCHSAVASAKKETRYKQINGCYYCCEDCHTQ